MKRSKPAKIADVADLAGLSSAAVSRYLNGRLLLPPETADRIKTAVLTLGYRPNAIARRLSLRKSETLGLVTSDIANPYFGAIASSAEQEALGLGFSLLIFNSRNAVSRELSFLSKILDQQVDGILFQTNHADDGSLRDKINACRHVVIIDEDVPGALAPRVFAENAEGARVATQHLIDNGHSRIACILGPKGLFSSVERFAGFNTAMVGAGLRVDPQHVKFGSFEEVFGRTTFHVLWQQTVRPTAIFAGADSIAIGIIDGAREAGVAIPTDLSLVGFDDIPYARLFDPPLTTVHQSPEELGRRGVQLLSRSLQGHPVAPTAERIPIELIVRGSVARPPS